MPPTAIPSATNHQLRHQPTPEQSAFIAALAQGQESICLNAVAGSGKTTTLVMASARVPNSTRVLALAFNKKIAAELAKRLPPFFDTLTLNSLGHRAWQQHLGKRLILNDRKVGEICSAICKEHEIQGSWVALKDLVLRAKDSGLAPSSLSNCIPLMADTTENWLQLIANFNIEGGEDLIPFARKALLESISRAMRGEIDFADQLYMSCVFRARMPQYQLVLVDEAQDLSEIQHELISRCVAPGGRLVAVGDPKQAIYGFRGASSNSMELLRQRFNMKEMDLSFTFRCPKVAVRLAQEIVPKIKYPDFANEGTFQNHQRNWQPKNFPIGSAILCRNIAPLVRLGFQCFRQEVSCWIVGRDIGAPIIKAAKELQGSNAKELHDSVRNWLGQKRTLANNNLEIIAQAEDTAESLHFVIENAKATSPGDIISQLEKLFSKESGSITLSTIHRAKGLEWDTVYLLDPWRIPAKYVKRAFESDPQACSWMMEQEQHLKYIAITRARLHLHFIEYEEYL